MRCLAQSLHGTNDLLPGMSECHRHLQHVDSNQYRQHQHHHHNPQQIVKTPTRRRDNQ